MSTTSTILFVDADNQPSTAAPELAAYLRAMGRSISRINVAGNGSGAHVAGWGRACDDLFPGAAIQTLVTPVRKQAADAWLLFEIGRLTATPLPDGTMIVIVSRDDILVAAAEQLTHEGVLVLLASHSAAPPPATMVGHLPLAVGNAAEAVRAASVDVASPSSILEYLRSVVPRRSRHPLRYAATDVGQALARLGMNRQMRACVLRQIPGLRTIGEGAHKYIELPAPEALSE